MEFDVLMTEKSSESDKAPMTPRMPYGPFVSRYICWRRGHDHVDDGFMGSSERCARCGAWDVETSIGAVDAFFIGLTMGVIGATIVAAAVVAL
jgi:uncharacterized protein (DUF983 family)